MEGLHKISIANSNDIDTFKQDLTTLNSKQLEAVRHINGPLLIVAGAGSGKTKTITYRIAYLIKYAQVSPNSILALTFTNKAALEMKERIANLLSKNLVKNLTISTFHSFCCMLLRKWQYISENLKEFVIYDEEDSEKLLSIIVKQLNLESKYSSSKLLSLISNLKSDLIEPVNFIPYSKDDEILLKVYTEYQRKLKEFNALDFDDILLETYKILKNNKDLLQNFQSIYKYFLVDEYQDTNIAQYNLLKLFCSHTRNLCVVGDEDQSIYSWRGANIRNIQSFEKDFPDAKVIILDQNYRSTQQILDAASKLISQNTRAYSKNLWSNKKDGEPVLLKICKDETDEATWVANEIIRLISKGYTYSSIAILIRMHHLSRAFEQALSNAAIPYEITGGIKFYNRKEVKDILSYLRVIQNPYDELALLRIINTPKRGIGDTTVDRLRSHYNSIWDGIKIEAGIDFEFDKSTDRKCKNKSLKEFYALITRFQLKAQSTQLSELVRELLEETNYLDYIKETEKDKIIANERIENVESLVSDIKNQEESEPNLTLQTYLEKAALQMQQDNLDEHVEKVHILTVHNAKGLEFPIVFVVAMESEIFPHYSAINSLSELEEERRLAYVALTRAKEKLYISYSKKRIKFGNARDAYPSQFISEIKDYLIDYDEYITNNYKYKLSTNLINGSSSDSNSNKTHSNQNISTLSSTNRSFPTINPTEKFVYANINNAIVGAEVLHNVFGRGKIIATEGTNISDYRITVNFKNVGKKILLLQYANIKVLEK